MADWFIYSSSKEGLSELKVVKDILQEVETRTLIYYVFKNQTKNLCTVLILTLIQKLLHTRIVKVWCI